MLAFELERPRSVAEAVMLLARNGGKAMAKAGGTDLLVWIKKHLVAPEIVVDLSGIPELRGISFSPYRGVRIGALATLSAIAAHDDVRRFFPAIADACLSHSDALVRNRATAVGNLCASVPSGDLLPALFAHEAEVAIFGPDGERRVSVSDFITGPRKNLLLPGEIVTSIFLPTCAPVSFGCYLKHSRRNALDLAQIGVACVVEKGPVGISWRLAYGAVAPRPVRARECEKMLSGTADPGGELLSAVAAKAREAVNPITDVRASREYRLDMVEALTKKAVRMCAEHIASGLECRLEGSK